MGDDISNKTIVVLVILTVIISLLGTLVVVNEVNNVKLNSQKTAGKSSSAVGKVELTILPKEEVSKSSQATGMVTLGIIPE